MPEFARRLQRPETLRAILDQLSDAVFLYDQNLRLVGVNKSGERLLGLPVDAMLGKACWKLFQVTSSEPMSDAPPDSGQSGSLPTGVVTLMLEDGTERRVILRSLELFDESGALEGLVATATDITEGATPVVSLAPARSFVDMPGGDTPRGQLLPKRGSRLALLAIPKKTAALAAGVLLLIFVAALAAILYVPGPRKPPSPEELKRAAQAKFDALTPAQHLEQAKSDLRPGASPDSIGDGLRHLKAIPSSAPEASRVKALQQDLTKALNLAAARALIESASNGEVADGMDKLQRAGDLLASVTRQYPHDPAAAELARGAQNIAEEIAVRFPEQFASMETKLVSFTWEKGGFGTVMMASFTVRNDSPVDVADLKIHCDHYGADGVVVDQNTGTAFGIVKAHSMTRFPNVNMGFLSAQSGNPGSSKTECQILSLKQASESAIYGATR